MKLVLKITAGLVLGLTVLILGCATMVGAGAESVSNEIEKTEQQSEAHSRDLDKKLAKIKHGMTRAEVIAIMGKPESSSKMDYDELGVSEMLTWDAAWAGKFVHVTLDDGIVTSIDKNDFDS